MGKAESWMHVCMSFLFAIVSDSVKMPDMGNVHKLNPSKMLQFNILSLYKKVLVLWWLFLLLLLEFVQVIHWHCSISRIIHAQWLSFQFPHFQLTNNVSSFLYNLQLGYYNLIPLYVLITGIVCVCVETVAGMTTEAVFITLAGVCMSDSTEEHHSCARCSHDTSERVVRYW